MPVLRREVETIEFGKPLPSLETFKLWLAHGIRNGGTALTITKNATDGQVDGTHPLAIITRAIWTAWPKLTADSGAFTSTTVMTEEIVFMNLGRLIRSKYEDEDLLLKIHNMSAELIRNHEGVSNSGSEQDDLILAIMELYFLVGKKLDSMFGDWSQTKNLRQDDAFAGLGVCLVWVVSHLNLHDISYMDNERKMATYNVEGGVVTGHFNDLNIKDPETYGSILAATENTGISDQGTAAALNLLGMSSAYVDEPQTKGFNVWLFDASEALAKRLLSESNWSWRFSRDIIVKPTYEIRIAEADDESGEEGSSLVEATMKNRPMVDYEDCCLLTFHRTVYDILAEFTSYRFKNKAFAGIKKRFKVVSIYDLPSPGVGTGGLLAYQMTHLQESAVGLDAIHNKLILDTQDEGHLSLQLRRESSNNKTFQVIGDVPIEDYRLMVGQNIEWAYIDGAKSATFAKETKYFSPYGGVIADFDQDEDRERRIKRGLYSLIDGGTDKGALDGKSHSPNEWVNGDSHVYKTTDYDYPVSLAHAKTIWYEGRAADPWKKLPHTVYDINELDVSLITDAMCDAYGFGAAKSEEIPVSAIKDEKPWEKDEKEEKEFPVSAIKKDEDIKETTEIEVSAVVDEKKKLDKLQKEVKVAKDKVTKETKKEANDKKKKEAKK